MATSATLTLFDGARSTLEDAWSLTIQSLLAYGAAHDHWALAWSGGKDSTATLTFLVYAIETGQVPAPKTLTVFYADTRLELLPLWLSAQAIIAQLRARRIDVRVVMAPLDKRFMVYILGRGVPPPNNATFRWCTEAIKVAPMHRDLERLACALGLGEMVEAEFRGKPVQRYRGFGGQRVLMLTGVRVGESAARDQRIALSCGRNGGECGQGWYQEALPDALCDTLAPLLHWRVCHVWDWLAMLAPQAEYGGWDTQLLALVYGADEAIEKQARTGCTGCPLTDKDTALDGLLAWEAPDGSLPWAYLAPLKRLRPLWRELRAPHHRLRKHGGERRKDGSLVENQNRMGPITLESRLWALEVVLEIQAEINSEADRLGRSRVDILNPEEEARIRELVGAGTWPEKWSGEEPRGDVFFTEAGDLFSSPITALEGPR